MWSHCLNFNLDVRYFPKISFKFPRGQAWGIKLTILLCSFRHGGCNLRWCCSAGPGSYCGHQRSSFPSQWRTYCYLHQGKNQTWWNGRYVFARNLSISEDSYPNIWMQKMYLKMSAKWHFVQASMNDVWIHCGLVTPYGVILLTSVQVITCCLTAPSHCLNQCWLRINEASWHSAEGSFTEIVPVITTKCMKIVYLKIIHLLGANELIAMTYFTFFQANCIDSTASAEAVFAGEVAKLRQEKIKPKEQLTLEPYERDHAVVVGIYRWVNSDPRTLCCEFYWTNQLDLLTNCLLKTYRFRFRLY